AKPVATPEWKNSGVLERWDYIGGESPRGTRGIWGRSGEGGRARGPDVVEMDVVPVEDSRLKPRLGPCRSSGYVRPVYGQTPSREFTRAHAGASTSRRRTPALPSPRRRGQ